LYVLRACIVGVLPLLRCVEEGVHQLRDNLTATSQDCERLSHRLATLESSTVPQQITKIDAVLSGLEGRLTLSEASLREELEQHKAAATVEVDSVRGVISEVQTILKTLPWRELQSDVASHASTIAGITARVDNAFDELKVLLRYDCLSVPAMGSALVWACFQSVKGMVATAFGTTQTLQGLRTETSASNPSSRASGPVEGMCSLSPLATFLSVAMPSSLFAVC
jgi:ABC-type transporter Mla subunit MlaD